MNSAPRLPRTATGILLALLLLTSAWSISTIVGCAPLAGGATGSQLAIELRLPAPRAGITGDAAVLSVQVALRTAGGVLIQTADLSKDGAGTWKASIDIAEAFYGMITFEAQAFGESSILYSGSVSYMIPDTATVIIPVSAVPSSTTGSFGISLDLTAAIDAEVTAELRVPKGETATITLSGAYATVEWELDGTTLAGESGHTLSIDTGASGLDLPLGVHDLTVYATDANGVEYSGMSYLTVTNELCVILHGNGGTAALGEETVQYYFYPGSGATLPAAPFTREGYVFLGWSPTNSGPTAFPDGGAYPATVSGTELVARWMDDGYSPNADFTWTLVDGLTASLTSYSGSAATVAIPPMAGVDGLYYPVTSIGSMEDGSTGAFAGTSVVSVAIPGTVRAIGVETFSGCAALETVAIPESVSDFGYSAFMNCTALKTVVLPSALTYIADDLFLGCSNLETAEIPATVTAIRFAAFSGCAKLAVPSLPPALETIDDSAFEGCAAINSLAIPESVASIGIRAFRGCTSLESVTLPAGLTTIADQLFRGCTALRTVGMGDAITAIGASAFSGCSSLELAALPPALESIGHSAFYNCASLTSLVIPDTVNSLGLQAFRGCTALESVTLPEGYASVPARSFWGCTALETVNFGGSVTSIGASAFQGCTSLAAIILPEGLTSIGASAFYGCTGIATITLNEGLASIDEFAFLGCTTLTTIELPASLTSLGGYVFAECAVLNAISVDSENASFSSLDGVLYDKAQAMLLCYPAGKTDLSWVSPATLTSTGETTFYMQAYLQSVVFSEGFLTLGVGTFDSCPALVSVTLPATTAEVQEMAFNACPALATVTILASSPPAAGADLFYESTGSLQIIVPSGTAATYAGTEGWSAYAAYISE